MDFDFEIPQHFTKECSVYVRFKKARLLTGLIAQFCIKYGLLT